MMSVIDQLKHYLVVWQKSNCQLQYECDCVKFSALVCISVVTMIAMCSMKNRLKKNSSLLHRSMSLYLTCLLFITKSDDVIHSSSTVILLSSLDT